MNQQSFRPIVLARFLLCLPFFIMLFLMLIEASLHAATTYLVIEAGRDVAKGTFRLADLMWILATESAAYLVGALSWVFAERAGFLAYGRYMLRFARDNRQKTKLLGDKEARERVEPFLTGETFYVYFHLLYEIEGDLRILLAIVLNVIVLGTQIDGSLPIAYAAVFAALFLMQWTMRKRVASAYRENQRMTNRMTAQGYTAWDNVFAGNRYNLRLCLGGFRTINQNRLDAQIRAIMTKEGLSAAGWNELLASWARLTGVADNMHPEADADYDARMKLDRLVLREGGNASSVTSLDDAMSLIFKQTTGRINVRGPNGAGKSTLLTSLKAAVKTRAYYWPTADRLAFAFTVGRDEVETDEDGDPIEPSEKKIGYSSGERQLRALQEIVRYTDAP